MTAPLSFNELEMLTLKAARGAGFAWGLAEEAAFAVRWLAERGVDGAAALLTCLDLRRDSPDPAGRPDPTGRHWRGQPFLCPLATGSALSDFAALPGGPAQAPLTLEGLSAPALILPFVSQVAARGNVMIQVDWPGFRGSLCPDGNLALNDGRAVGVDSAEVRLVPCEIRRGRAARQQDDTDDASVLERMAAYGARTYVPASDASRKGAGAEDRD